MCCVRDPEESPEEATGESVVQLQHFGDINTMQQLSRTAAAIGWGWPEHKRQLVCAADCRPKKWSPDDCERHPDIKH